MLHLLFWIALRKISNAIVKIKDDVAYSHFTRTGLTLFTKRCRVDSTQHHDFGPFAKGGYLLCYQNDDNKIPPSVRASVHLLSGYDSYIENFYLISFLFKLAESLLHFLILWYLQINLEIAETKLKLVYGTNQQKMFFFWSFKIVYNWVNVSSPVISFLSPFHDNWRSKWTIQQNGDHRLPLRIE